MKRTSCTWLCIFTGPLLLVATPLAAQPTAEERGHWSFRTLRRPEVPKVQSPRSRTPIDAFLLDKLKSKGLDFAKDADKPMLLRRVYLDLLGLPPNPDEIRQFVADDRPDAYERLLDRLLASPQFGVRWGRHWLDAAGYADVGGTDNDAGIIRMAEGSWRYRDYVIRSFNEDKPFDQFLLEQLAGDELDDWRAAKTFTPAMRDRLIATGFLRTAADDTEENELNTLDIRHGVLHRTAEVVASNVLGLTLNCAKCHDHKYEPISHEDYYRFIAVFSPAFNPQQWLQPKVRMLADVPPPEKSAIDKDNAHLASQVEELKKKKLELKKDPKAAADLDVKIGALNAKKKSYGQLRAVYDAGPPTPTRLLRRGDHAKPGKEITVGGLEVLCPPAKKQLPDVKPAGATSGRRLALAQWLTEPSTPASGLVARTQVNRVWQRLFGKGIVPTSDNLGMSGARPSHPELLDWLAAEFVDKKWRLKPLLRQIMTSSAYRQSSLASPDAAKVDPANHLLWRMPLRRLEAEIVRDSILAVSGKLDPTVGGPPTPLENRPDGLVVVKDPGKYRRTVYVLARRNYHPTLLNVFDQPFMTTNNLCRSPSAVVLQSLTMLNDTFIVEQAGVFAERVLRDGKTDALERQVESAYLLALTRPPSAKESAACMEFLRRQTDRHSAAKLPSAEAPRRALANLCHVLLNTSEFLYVP
ncbi:MAG: DUF1553 domain-containing protein [Gemmataceae bacterium]|nr:DUF1553 domain-containing protein [Gemmataceae bacterium]